MKLTKNNQLVLDTLLDAGHPMGAYEIIDAVRSAGIAAPPTVYRALNKLIDLGMVHRVESHNAFVACNGSHPGGSSAMLMICSKCGHADEFFDPAIRTLVWKQAQSRHFTADSTPIEVQGTCAECRSPSGRLHRPDG